MAQQLPDYRPAERGTEAPPGFQPQQANPQRQTQRNNGGPIGLGQPSKNLKTAINPNSAPTPAPAGPQPGTGNPQSLYPADPMQNAERDLWSNRNSLPPTDLIQKAFTAFLRRPAQPHEIQTLLAESQSADHLVQQLLSLKPAPQAANLQSAVLGI